MLKYIFFYFLPLIAMEPPKKEEGLTEFFESKGLPSEVHTEIEKFRFPNYDLLADFLARTQLANQNYTELTSSALDDSFLFPPFFNKKIRTLVKNKFEANLQDPEFIGYFCNLDMNYATLPRAKELGPKEFFQKYIIKQRKTKKGLRDPFKDMNATVTELTMRREAPLHDINRASVYEIKVDNGKKSTSFYSFHFYPGLDQMELLSEYVKKIVEFARQKNPSFVRIIFQADTFDKKYLYSSHFLGSPTYHSYHFLLNETKKNILFQDKNFNSFLSILEFNDLPDPMPIKFFKIKNKEGSTILFNKYDKLNEKYAHQDKEIARYLKYAYKNEFNFAYDNPSGTSNIMYKRYLDKDASEAINQHIFKIFEDVKTIERELEKAIKLGSSKYINAFFECIKTYSGTDIEQKMKDLLLGIINKSSSDINLVNDDHKTIFNYALDIGDQSLIDTLKEKGAKTGIEALISGTNVLSESQKEYLRSLSNLLCDLIHEEKYHFAELLLRIDPGLKKHLLEAQGTNALICAQNMPAPNVAFINKLQEETVYNRSKVKWALRYQKWNLAKKLIPAALLVAAILNRKRIISLSTPYASQFWQHIKKSIGKK